MRKILIIHPNPAGFMTGKESLMNQDNQITVIFEGDTKDSLMHSQAVRLICDLLPTAVLIGITDISMQSILNIVILQYELIHMGIPLILVFPTRQMLHEVFAFKKLVETTSLVVHEEIDSKSLNPTIIHHLEKVKTENNTNWHPISDSPCAPPRLSFEIDPNCQERLTTEKYLSNLYQTGK